ncbi:hypothetical protein GCM10009079_03260 [Ralstonia mannitolilytica]
MTVWMMRGNDICGPDWGNPAIRLVMEPSMHPSLPDPTRRAHITPPQPSEQPPHPPPEMPPPDEPAHDPVHDPEPKTPPIELPPGEVPPEIPPKH